MKKLLKKKEEIKQICYSGNNNPIILTSSGRILTVIAYPLKDVNGFVYNYGYKWQEITPKLEEI